MRRTVFASLLVVLIAASVLALRYFQRSRVQRAAGYNVLLISLDTVRADFLGCYGNPVVSTPNIDRLAKSGVLFENYYSAINTTLAAHSTMFTGYYPRNHGVGRNSMRLISNHLTLPEYLAANGYGTAGFIGSFALASVFGIHQGFRTYDESFLGEPESYVREERKRHTAQDEELEMLVFNKRVGHLTRTAEEVNKAFYSWLDKNSQTKFFAFVHYYDPHFPYYPPEKWRKTAIPEGTPISQEARKENAFQEWIDPDARFIPARFQEYAGTDIVRTLLELYQAEIEYVDYAIGQLLEDLSKRGLADRTVVILTADHGENLVEHHSFNSFFRHGTLTYDTETKIPLILSAPGILPKGKRLADPCSQTDFFPTLIDLIALDQPYTTDGISLLPVLFGEDSDPNSDRMIFTEASQPRASLKRDASKMSWVNDWNAGAVRWREYKYMNVPHRQFEAIYRLPEDPREEKNLLSPLTRQQPELVESLREGLESWRKKAFRDRQDREFDLSEEEKEKLESLGYVQ